MSAQYQPDRPLPARPAPPAWLRLAALISLVVLLAAATVLAYAAFIGRGAPAAEEPPVIASSPPESGTPLDPPRELADFALASQSGAQLRLSDLRGKYVLLFFGYTHCPDICPTTLSDFVLVKRRLGTLADQVRFVFVSVDGERDTPPVLERFMKSFDPSFIALQGDDTTLGRIGKDYGLYYKKEQVAGTSQPYLVAHSSSSYLIDRSGRMRMVYGFGMSPQVIADDIANLYAHE